MENCSLIPGTSVNGKIGLFDPGKGNLTDPVYPILAYLSTNMGW
jgi:hypothetical protein